jgi:hypothetical protein
MPTFDQNLIDLIEQRIRAAQARTEMRGTCVDRDPTGPGATVIFDGDVFAVPVKVLGHVLLKEGYRCVLGKYGSDWIVTGSWANPAAFGEASHFGTGPAATTTTTSAVYTDLTDVPPITFTKYYDATYMQIAVQTGAFAATAGAAVRFGIRLTPQDASSTYTPTDYNVIQFQISPVGTHEAMSGACRQIGIPAGTYTAQLRWLRSSGTGTLSFNNGDPITIQIDEAVRFVAPIL